MKIEMFYTLFQDTIWNVIPMLHCPFKDKKKVKMSYIIHFHTHTKIVCTYIYFKYKMWNQKIKTNYLSFHSLNFNLKLNPPSYLITQKSRNVYCSQSLLEDLFLVSSSYIS